MSEYNFNDVKYDYVKDRMKDLIESDNDKEEVKNLTFTKGIDPETMLMIYRSEASFPKDITVEIWKQLYEFMEKKDKKTFGLVKGTINDSSVSTDGGSQWQQYKKALKRKKFSSDSIRNIEESSAEILKQLDKNTLNKKPVKGLVVGSVQSGKTANMIGLMSMAADYGFNYFIIFSGIIDNLRIQTESRMYSDLNLHGNLNWIKLSKPSLKSREPELSWANIKLDKNSKNRYFTVSLKNKKLMDDLVNWLYSNEDKLKQLKVLIIDDEADQASINTKDITKSERTSINEAMLKTVEGVNGKKMSAVNYISYTATPYANALNETGGLFPSNFVYSLPLSEDYIGPEEIFGLQEPEQYPLLEISREIDFNDVKHVNELHKGERSVIPKSLKQAITWFFLSAAAFRIYGRKSPVSMLVHTSYRTNHHKVISTAIRQYLLEIRANQNNFIESARKLYTKEIVDFPKSDFIRGMPNYSTKDDIKDYPPFNEIEIQLRRVLDEEEKNYVSHIPINDDGTLQYTEGFHIIEDNSSSDTNTDEETRLFYPSSPQTKNAPMFIVIGGNTLSRGLTLEGLTSSYFLRTTKQADTLFQMGRWFGYRKGYELLPRIWLDNESRERFEYIAQINRELIETIEDMSIKGETPRSLGIHVKNSPDNKFLRLTSPKKQQAAVASKWNFSNISKQTIIFANDKEELTHNLNLTKDFLNTISKNSEPVITGSAFVWRNITYDKVRHFLSNFKFSTRDTFFRNMDVFLDWFDNTEDVQSDKYQNWNIILATKDSIGQPITKSSLEINGHSFTPVRRSKKYNLDSKSIETVSIGALRSPRHMIADVHDHGIKGTPSQKQVRDVRKAAGLGMVPQIILYIIDKDSKPDNNTKRKPLNFEEHPVGINLYIPGNMNNKNIASYLSVKPQVNEDDDDYDNISDEDGEE